MKIKRELLIIFAIQVTEVLGFSLILPFLPLFAQDLGASPFQVGLILASFSLFQFISAPIMGKLSDSYGRRPMLLLSQFSTFLGFLILGFSNTLWMIVLSRVVDGLLGSNFTIAQAYISDVSSKKDRSKAFGLSGAAFGVGFFIGPAVGGFLSQFGLSVPAFLAAILTIGTILLTYFKLPETIKNKREFKFDVKILNFDNFTKYFSDKKIAKKMWELSTYFLTHQIFVGTFALFLTKRLGVGASFIGYTFAFIGFSNIFIRTVLLSKIIDIVGEENLKIYSFFIQFILFFLMAFVSQIWMFLIIMFVFVLANALLRPVMMGDISKSVSENEQGAILGLTNSVGSLTQIAGPLLGGFLLDRFFEGSVPLVSSAIILIGFVMAWRERKNGYRSEGREIVIKYRS